MATNEKPELSWKSLRGKSLAEDYRPGNIKTTDGAIIGIFETPGSVRMGDGVTGEQPAEPYGIPITAELGIGLIADLQYLILPIAAADTKESFTAAITDESFETLKQLLRHSSAITIDKNVLLKTLSQPGCEGIRFYLCKKIIEDASYLSLVTVGVTSDGQDLHYEYTPGKLQSGLKEAALPTSSLVSEYGSPPPPSTLALADAVSDKFALLKYALEEAENIQKEKLK
jgi:hypothetical protein